MPKTGRRLGCPPVSHSRAAEDGLHIPLKVQQLLQAAPQLRECGLQIGKARPLAQQLLVHNQGEVHVQHLACRQKREAEGGTDVSCHEEVHVQHLACRGSAGQGVEQRDACVTQLAGRCEPCAWSALNPSELERAGAGKAGLLAPCQAQLGKHSSALPK